jgi:CrcB protein
MSSANLTLICVGLGGALGAILRALTGLLLSKTPVLLGIPLATLSVNILGSLLIGIFLTSPQILSHPQLKAFLTAGLMGGLTTFSTFSFDNINLIEHKMLLQAALNICLNVFLGLGACYLGTLIGRSLNI